MINLLSPQDGVTARADLIGWADAFEEDELHLQRVPDSSHHIFAEKPELIAATLEKLELGGNKLGGTITDDITAFTKLTELRLFGMDLKGTFVVLTPVRVAPTLRDGTESEISHTFSFPAMCRRNSRVDREPDEPAAPRALGQCPHGCVIRFQNA